MSKRLTDAECAAEYWRAIADDLDDSVAEEWGCSVQEDDWHTTLYEDDFTMTVSSLLRMPSYAIRQHVIDTWSRFATHPHAHEAN